MKKVIVAMSGGVDSSVSALLLKKAGFDVKGIFMKLVDSSFSKEGQRRAEQVAKILKIPFLVIDFKKEFKKKIIKGFLDGYKKGITPNPCVICNKEIKFGFLLEKTIKMKADYLATGHYVFKKGEKLFKSKNKDKDQSYFLWKLNCDQVMHILFPVGNLEKIQVRTLAKKFKLPVYNTPESQEICFVTGEIKDFLKKNLRQKPGNIINSKGKILGRHDGLSFYTIGQRKGIKLSGGPYYVLKKDLKKNILIITKNEKDLLGSELVVNHINWVSGKAPKFPVKVQVKIRYRTKPVSAVMKSLTSELYILKFNKFQRAITPGQSAVFYNKKELLGGGIIIR